MKSSKFIKKILMLVFLCSLLLSGCHKSETVFVDAGYREEENGSAEAVMQSLEEVATGELPEERQSETVTVHLCGAVVNPGVYELSTDGRIIDAVNLAGGLTKEAADDYVNLAGRLSDAEQIYVPTREEVETMQVAPKWQQTSELGRKVNINTADETVLCTLPGIGQTRAQSIIAYRQEHGCFTSVDDIMNVSGIKESSFQKIKEYITVN